MIYLCSFFYGLIINLLEIIRLQMPDVRRAYISTAPTRVHFNGLFKKKSIKKPVYSPALYAKK